MLENMKENTTWGREELIGERLGIGKREENVRMRDIYKVSGKLKPTFQR